MKKILFAVFLFMNTNIYGQSNSPMPEYYDTNIMLMYLNALRETYPRRKAHIDNVWDNYLIPAYNRDYRDFLDVSECFIEDELICEEPFFWELRGEACEKLYRYEDALKQYKTAKYYGSKIAKQKIKEIKLILK